jgi:competence CoiA-like predicted nuclease
MANLISRLHQQVKANAGNVGAAMAKANQANSEATTLKTQLVGMYQTQRAEEEKLTRQVNGQLYQLTLILNQTQQEFRQHNLAPQRLPGGGVPVMGPVMVNGVPVEIAVAQLQLKIKVVQSHLRSDSASIAGHVFESYEDTLAWVVAHCSP